MNFRGSRRREEPEINFVPLIDLLLVILIFLTVTTTYSRLARLQVDLPVADAEQTEAPPAEIAIVVAADGRYALAAGAPKAMAPAALATELAQIAVAHREPMLVIHADGGARHQSVVAVLEAARRAGIYRVTFAAHDSATGASEH